MTKFVPIIGADYPAVVVPLLDSAKKNIDIVVYDWRWYPNDPAHPVQKFNSALVRAVKRGVIVRAVLNSGDLLPLLNRLGIKARRLSDSRTLHSKFIIIDDEILVIGSHNFTRNAFGSNVECSVAVSIPSAEIRFNSFFKNIYPL